MQLDEYLTWSAIVLTQMKFNFEKFYRRKSMAEKLLPFYNVEQAVGKNGFNQGSDVLLIQFFLSEIGKVPPHPIPPPTTPLVLNGDPNSVPLLITWIEWFQKGVKAVGNPGVVDGRVDSAKTFDKWSYFNNTKGLFVDGTMQDINFAYRRRFKKAHNDLAHAPNCPPQLFTLFID